MISRMGEVGSGCTYKDDSVDSSLCAQVHILDGLNTLDNQWQGGVFLPVSLSVHTGVQLPTLMNPISSHVRLVSWYPEIA